MAEWKRIEPTEFIKANRRGITVKTFRRPDGVVSDFDIFDRDNVEHAGTVALTPDNKVIVAEQFRAGPEQVMFEIPGGTADPGEDPLEAARRELLEETCYRPEFIEPLGLVYKDAYMNARWYYFFATGCTLQAKRQDLDEDEQVTVTLLSVDEFIQNARKGRMTDVEAVFLAYEKLLKLRRN